MREIKFRAWDNERGRYLSPAELDGCGLHPTGNLIRLDNSPPFNAYEQDPVFMQYTGLKDKNGVEIYEGDIVKHLDFKETMQIKWIGSGLACWIDDGNWSLMDTDGEVEILGNIYENPELMR